LVRRLDESRLAKVLTAVYRPQIEEAWPRWLAWLRGRLGLKERA